MTTARLIDAHWDLEEEVLGCARRTDGRYFVVLNHAVPTAECIPELRGVIDVPHPFMFISSHHDETKFCWIMSAPQALVEFIMESEVGTTGKVSNRKVEIVDPSEAVPDGKIVIDRSFANWVGY